MAFKKVAEISIDKLEDRKTVTAILHANGLWQKSQHISEAEAKPGDLVFFEGTYDTPGKSHVGIYLGNGKERNLDVAE